ncbi:MAG: transglutaminase protein [Candidatus Eremiobacteraeota bacterium]|jgi:transglutaminase-like putative cysteine protease|nr:transglutaminase protein [Candidatus Eremiobacteraeota bacterium]
MSSPVSKNRPGRIVRASYELRQQFRYEYPGPIEHLEHRLVVAPPAVYGDQRRVHHQLRVSPELPARWDYDTFGNLVVTIEAARVEHAVQLDYEAIVERSEGPALEARWNDDPHFRLPSSLTLPSDALREAARELMAQDEGCGNLATRINAFVFKHMRYVPDTTTVDTTAAHAFALGTGVCQDYAHIMIALCRLCGIPARYVSGHLLGEGGTHAWLEAIEYAPNTGIPTVAAFDPTHDRRATLDYVFVAAGRDYADVAPTSGRFVAPYIGRFTTSRNVDVVGVEYAA